MKLKNVLIIAIAILSLGLIVACSDDVVATKDNNLNAYRVTESNGAFVYNETKYETLQDALDAIEKGKDIVFPEGAKTIKVTRSVTGPVAKVAADQEVLLDLGGNTLTFYGVKDSALTIGSGTKFGITNGTLTLADKGNEDLAVIGADGATELLMDGVTINAEGQKTIDVSNVNRVTVLNSSSINGETILKNVKGSADGDGFNTASNTSVEGTLVAADGSVLNINNDMGAGISLDGSIITVSGTGHAIIDKVSGVYTVNAANESAITDNTEGHVIVPTVGICKITRDAIPTIYGDLKAALDSLDQDGRTIVLIANETTVYESALRPNNDYSVIIDLNGYDVTPIDTIEPIITVTNITSAGAITLKSSSDGSEFKGSITCTGTEEGTGITVDHVQVDGNVTSACSVTIQNGSIVGPTALVDVYAPVVTVINSKIGANTISANGTMSNPATSVSITNSNGTIRKIYAQAASSTATAITLSSSSSESLVVGDSTHDDSTTEEKENVLIANRGAVSITGYSTEYSVKVYENIVVSDGNLGTQKAEIYGTVGVTGNMTDGTISGSSPSYTYANGSKFGKGITVTGAGRFYGSTFNPNGTGLTANVELKAATLDIGGSEFKTTSYGTSTAITDDDYTVYFNVETSGADSGSGTSLVSPLTITASKGEAGSVKSTGGSIKIDNSAFDAAENNLTTSRVEAFTGSTYYDVFVYGPTDGSTLTVASIAANDITISRATVNGEANANNVTYDSNTKDAGVITSDNSVFNDVVNCAVLNDGNSTTTPKKTGSTFKGNVNITANDGYTDATGAGTFYSSTFNPVSLSTNRTLSAEKVSINNSTFGNTLFDATEPTADYYVYYDVETSGADSGSETSLVSPLTITASKGTAGNLTSTGGSIKVDNSSISADSNNLKTLAVTAKASSAATYYDVFVYGPSANSTLTIGSVNYAKGVTSQRAVFAGIVGGASTSTSAQPVASLIDGTVSNNTYSNGSKFQGDVTATGAVVLYNSTTEADVTSTTSISAYNATLGDSASYDDIYAPVVSITDSSKIKLNSILGNGGFRATSVTITDPDKYLSTESSTISSIITASLSVTAANNNLIVTRAEATGAATINGGTFNQTALSGTTNINGGKFTEGSLDYDHSLSGKTTITGGIFTAAVKLSGEYANSITDCSFNEGTTYGSFTYTGTGTLNISGGTFSGTNSFAEGTTTITGGSFGHYTSSGDCAWTSFTGTADVYVENLIGGLYLGNTSSSGFVTFTKGTVYVNSGANLGYAGSHVVQSAYSDVLTICVVDNTILTSNVTLSSAILNLNISVADGKYLYFDSSNTSSTNYNMYLASSTGNYTLSGTFATHNDPSNIYYHQGVNITSGSMTYGVTLAIF